MELLNLREAHLVGLLLMRNTGMVLSAPFFTSRALPMALKAAVIVLFTLLLFPIASIAAPDGARIRPSTFLAEITVGVILGLGSGLMIGAAEAAGDTLAVQMGLSGANVVNPISATQLPVLGQLLGLTVTTLLLVTGAHLVVLRALSASIELLPPGSTLETAGLADLVGRYGTVLFGLGLRIAAPVVAAMLLGYTALGVFARAVPQLNVLMLAFPLQIGLGLLTLSFLLPLAAPLFASWADTYLELIRTGLENLQPAGTEGGL